MAHRVPITIRLERFEGPLDLLLYLIQSHELDISKISIGKITEQYVAYVRLMQELNFDIASDFLVMAATLIQWKSKALLPVEETAAGAQADEDDVLTPEELMRQLMEHQRFLEMGRELAALPMLGDDVFKRQITRPPTEKVWKSMEVTQLALTLQDLLVRERKRTQLLKKETVSLSTKIMDFADRLAVGKIVGMSSLIQDMKSRPERVVTFLASLELSRLRKMKVYQEGTYEEIYVELLESLKGFDSRLASGFDALSDQLDKQIEAGVTSASADFVPGPDHIAGHAPAEFHSIIENSAAESDSTGSDLALSAGDDSATASAPGGDSPSEAESSDPSGVDERMAHAAESSRGAESSGASSGSAADAFDLHSFGEDAGALATDSEPVPGTDSESGEPAHAEPGVHPAASDRDELDSGRTSSRHE